MKHGKRTLLLALVSLLLVLMLALTACGGGGSDDDDDGKKPGNKPSGKPEDDVCTHEWVETYRSEGNCRDKIFAEYFCEKCKETKSEDLGYGEHPEEALREETGRPATCYDDGYTDSVYCECCGTYVEPYEVIPAGHDVVEQVAVAPTCTEPGYLAGRYCTRCDWSDPTEMEIPALGHDIVYSGGRDMTCLEDGLTDAEDCVREGCDYHVESQVIGAPGEHDMYVFTPAVAPTCTEDGCTEGARCQNYWCNYVVESETVQSLGHDIRSHESHAATCTEEGLEGGKYCAREDCGLELTASSTTARVDCVFGDDGVCASCGKTVSSGLTFIAVDGGYALADLGGFSGSVLVVPSTYEGEPVVAVSANALTGNATVTKIYLPRSIETIEAGAFVGATSLERIVFPDFECYLSLTVDGVIADAGVAVSADYSGDLTPYETYLVALAMMKTDVDRYRLEIEQMVYENSYMDLDPNTQQPIFTTEPVSSSIDITEAIREMAGDDWHEYLYAATGETVSGQTTMETATLETWYVDGILYQDIDQRNTTQRVKYPAGGEYMRHLAAAAAGDLPTMDEKYFANVDFYLDGDVYYLYLLMDNEMMLEYVLAQIPGFESMKEMIEITLCEYIYKMDLDGHLISIEANTEIKLEAPMVEGGEPVLLMDGGGHTSFLWSEVGTLASVTQPTGSFTDLTDNVSGCTHGTYFEETNPGYAATCTEDGLTDGIWCSRCYGDVQVATVIPATGHADHDGDDACDTCGALVGAAAGLAYEFAEDGRTVTVTGIGSFTGTELDVPEELYGMTVTAIAAGAFRDSAITSVIIPETITEIGEGAFPETVVEMTLPAHLLSALPDSVQIVRVEGGDTIAAGSVVNKTDLWKIYLGDSVKTIEDGAFVGCTNLYVVGDSWNNEIALPEIGSDALGGIVKHAMYVTNYDYQFDDYFRREGDFLFYSMGWNPELFAYLADDAVVTLPADFDGEDYYLGDGVFTGKSIERVNFPADMPGILNYIDDSAFVGCTSLTTIAAPYEVFKELDSDTFSRITHAIVLSGENVGILKEQTEALKTITYAAGVTSIQKMANISVDTVIIESASTLINSSSTFGKIWMNGEGDEEGRYVANLKNVTLPEDITEITGFSGATALEEIVIPEGVTSIGYCAFQNCTALTTVTLPSTLEEVCESAFYGCTSLESLSFPASIKRIGPSALRECTSLSSVSFEALNHEDGLALESYAFSKTALTGIAIPEGVTLIDNYCFYQSASLTEVAFPSTLLGIGDYAFVGTALAEVILPEGLTRVGYYAFRDLGLERVVLPSTLSQSSYAFSGAMVQRLVASAGLTEIGEYTFGSASSNENNATVYTLEICQSLATVSDSIVRKAYEIINASGNTALDTSSFSKLCEEPHAGPDSRIFSEDGVVFYAKADGSITLLGYLGEVPEELVLPTLSDGRTYSIGDYAFYDQKIVKLTIPAGVVGMGECAFAHNRDLLEVYFNATIPEGAVGYSVFAYTGTSTTVLTIGKDVASIPSNCFSNGNNESLTCDSIFFEEGSICSSIGDYAFRGVSVRYVEFPSSIETIGMVIFGEFSRLEEIVWGVTNAEGISNTAFSYYTSSTGFYDHLPDIVVTVKNNVKTFPCLFAYNGFGYRVTEIIFEEGSVLEVAPAFHDGRGEGDSHHRITSLVLPDSVKSIPDYAYYHCGNLTSVTLPEGLESIGEYAFSTYLGTPHLTNVNLPSTLKTIGDYAFSHSGLTEVTLPAGLTAIGEGAFRDCASLTSVTFPTGEFSLGTWAFRGCSSLTEVYIPDGATSIGIGVFQECIALETLSLPYVHFTYDGQYSDVDTKELYRLFYFDESTVYALPDNIQNLKYITVRGGEIVASAFQKMGDIEEITLTGDITSIGNSAFSNCSSLNKLVLNCDIESIGTEITSRAIELHIKDLASWCGLTFGTYRDNPMYYATALYVDGEAVTDLVIPEGVTSIGNYAFNYIEFLTSVTLPSTIETIGDYAFYCCTGITEASLNEGLTSIGEAAFGFCEALTEITLPASLETLGKNAFSYCDVLTTLTFADGIALTVIPDYAFNACPITGVLEIPEGVTSIGYSAFSCLNSHEKAKITEIVIPKTVQSIDKYAFAGCVSLVKLTISEEEGAADLRIDEKAFQDHNLTSLIIPKRVTYIGNWAFLSETTTMRTVYLRASSDSGFAMYWDQYDSWGMERIYYTVEYNYTGE